MYEVNLPEIIIVNLIGIMLMIGVMPHEFLHMEKSREEKMLIVLSVCNLISCMAEPLVFIVDGRGEPGLFALNQIFNFWLYLSNIIISPLWISAIEYHLNGKNSKRLACFMYTICGLGLIGLVINLFQPFLYWFDENHRYVRGDWFFVYTGLSGVFIVIGLVLYGLGRIRGGAFKFYPVFQFFLPVIVCMGIQSAGYGVSTFWCGIAVGITVMSMSIQRENLFKDKLTGLYNRYYLDKLEVEKRNQREFCMMMIDMNDFKQINDDFGHLTGDQALVDMAGILRGSVANRGTVIRYAGDEFVALINLATQEEAEAFNEELQTNIKEFNKKNNRQYKLSASSGYGIFDLQKISMDEIVEMVDRKMYENKEQYYINHDRRRK
ncbi:MAG: GGDEF domain-containing protein [Eubacterium sp.]|nr:GGDEF domain-containing protein [Eubacterium sp.]